jgi:phenylacetate-CoA ligase
VARIFLKGARPLNRDAERQRPRSPHDTLLNYARLLWSTRKRLRDQWLSRDALRALQSIQLRRLLSHAYEKVPYYRRLFARAGIVPGDITSIDDLPRLPVTTKGDIRELPPDQITARGSDLRSRHICRTSGSTGIPLKVYWDEDTIATFLSTGARAHRILGSSIWDRLLSIGPSFYPSGTLVQKLGICRVEKFSPFNRLEDQVAKINQCNPDILLCYPSVLKSLHHYIRKTNRRVHRPSMVLTSGEYLDDKTSRDAEEVFGSRPFQLYGAWEIGRIGNHCLCRSGIHLNEDIVIPEFVPAGEQYGENAHWLVLTNLHNYTMPFIRYQLGDIVRPIHAPCGCGRSFRRIEMVEARGSDVVHLPDGNRVSSLYLNAVLARFPSISQFKFIQESPDRLRVLLVDTAELPRESIREAIAEIATVLPGVRAEIERVEHIAPGPTGKFRRFESALHGYGDGGT